MQYAIPIRVVPARWPRDRRSRVSASVGGGLTPAACVATLELPA